MAQAKKTTATAKAASQGIRRVAVIGGNRIPFARSNTAYSKISNQELLTSALRGLVDRFNLDGMRMGEVVAGAVIKHSRDFNLTRESVLSCGLAPETPAYDIQQACGTGLEAAVEGRLVTFGIVPSHPETGYGYVKARPEGDGPVAVEAFVEKPDLDTARAYVEGGAHFGGPAHLAFQGPRRQGLDAEQARVAGAQLQPTGGGLEGAGGLSTTCVSIRLSATGSPSCISVRVSASAGGRARGGAPSPVRSTTLNDTSAASGSSRSRTETV